MLDLEPRHLDMVLHVIRKHLPEGRVIAFGSRVKGNAQRFSDLDLALEAAAPVPFKTLALIDQDLSDSDLPMKVDVVDMNSVSPSFKERILSSGTAL